MKQFSVALITLVFLTTTTKVIAQSDSASVQFIQNIPDVNYPAIDIYIDSVLAFDSVPFRAASHFFGVTPGVQLQFGFASSESEGPEDILETASYTLSANNNYIIMVHGLLSDLGYDPLEDFEVSVFAGAHLDANGGTFDILPFHGVTDAPNMTVHEAGIGLGPLTVPVGYGAFNPGYVPLSDDNFYLQTRFEDDLVPLATYKAYFNNMGLIEQAGVLFTSGFTNPSINSDGASFASFMALASGEVIELTPLGEAPANNLCVDATPIILGGPDTCGENLVTGDLTNAWNSTLAGSNPLCEIEGIYSDVYYSFNTGSNNQVIIDIASLVSDSTEVGYVLSINCNTQWMEQNGCISFANDGGPTPVYVPLNTDFLLRIFSNRDISEESGEFTLCVEGNFIESVPELLPTAAITAYPNPTTGLIAIANTSERTNLNVVLTDVAGKLVANEVHPNYNGVIILDMVGLHSGIYLVSLIDNNLLIGKTTIAVE